MNQRLRGFSFPTNAVHSEDAANKRDFSGVKSKIDELRCK
jgi:hypothetical protein